MSYAPLHKIRPFKILGIKYDGNDVAEAVAFNGSVANELAANASWIAFWGQQVAIAKATHDQEQAAYRAARDTFSKALRARADVVEVDVEEEDADEAPARGKVKAPSPTKIKRVKLTEKMIDEEWRAHPTYQSWYDRLAEAEFAWNAATYVYEACVKKSANLGAMTKHALDELAAIARSRGQS